jgi:hypothetical protein
MLLDIGASRKKEILHIYIFNYIDPSKNDISETRRDTKLDISISETRRDTKLDISISECGNVCFSFYGYYQYT